MKKTILLLLAAAFFSAFANAQSAQSVNDATINVFSEVLYYDGYAALVSEPVPAGVIRHRNDLYARKLTADEIAQIGTTLTMNVTIKASCDNYDRIGNVNLAFVPKGSETYNTADVKRIEIGRFITPFMNKNVLPDQVPYTYTADNLAAILKDPSLNALYDFWVELQVFGVPYAAQEQITGCAGRNDVFFGSLDFVTTGSTDTPVDPVLLIPLSFQADFNNYSITATDMVGTTQKTITFALNAPAENVKLYLITSNHGSNTGGEEYVRRFHYVYFDDAEVLEYRPGGISCEPYRMYNTQGNGIYGTTVHTTNWWTSWNNWCPGNSIPVREIVLGSLAAGTHTFKINVPTAQFADGQGNFPLSVYLQGVGPNQLSVPGFAANPEMQFYPNPASDRITFSQVPRMVEAVTTDGKLFHLNVAGDTADISSLPHGVFMLRGVDAQDRAFNLKLIK